MGTRLKETLRALRARRNPRNIAGMARFGINPRGTLGVPMPVVRGMARKIGRDHALAISLWRSGVHEARILAALVAEPAKTTPAMMEGWARAFDSWDVCDQVCSNLFDRTPHAWAKARAWSRRREEFVRRAGFVLMAALAVHDKRAPDPAFRSLFPLMLAAARDERNFVRKAVNWALRQVGKRNAALNRAAVAAARRMLRLGSGPAKWIAADALRELSGAAVRRRLARKQGARGRRI